MKITVFTRNQPRHLHYVRQLSQVADYVHAFIEVNTIFPGVVSDFYDNSPFMRSYFSKVRRAEREIFGDLTSLGGSVSTYPLLPGDLNLLERKQMKDPLQSDLFLVFGSSWIRGWLGEELSSRRAVNIHMGISPYYRGSSCNFWAMHDGNPGFVGATIHYLSPELDGGPILFHTRPVYRGQDSFAFSMESVLAAQKAIIQEVEAGTILQREGERQDPSLLIRYSKNNEFTEEVARDFLLSGPDQMEFARRIDGANPQLILQ